MISRKDKIYQYVKKYTRNMIDSQNLEHNGVDALEVALSLKLDRTNVSRELNALWKEGKVIKLQGRPTLYIDYQIIKTEYPNRYIPLVISRESSLLEFIQKSEKEEHKDLPFHQTPLDNIIGANGSLKTETIKFIAAISYPPCGLPVLLMGNAGVGKRKFAESIYYYALEKHILKENAPFIIINCQDYSHSEERFMTQLLGSRKNSINNKTIKGLIDSAGKGIVYFDGLHKLPSKSIDLIIDILKNGSYTRIGDSHSRALEAKFIASIRESIDAELLDNIKDTFPVIISLPDFDKRNSLEKLETILYLFTREAFSIHKNIRLDKSILSVFAMSHYRKNESQLRNEIQSTCAKAFLNQHHKDAPFITISFEHLSSFLLSATRLSADDNNSFINTLSMYRENMIVCEANGHCDALEYYKKIQQSSTNMNQFIKQFDIDINAVTQYETIIYRLIDILKYCDQEQIHELQKNIDSEVSHIFYKTLSQYNDYQKLLENHKIMTGLLVCVSNLIKKISRASVLDSHSFSVYHPKEYQLSVMLLHDLECCHQIPFCENTTIFVCVYLFMSIRILNQSYLSILIVCHGQHIASELKAYTDQMADEANIRTGAINYTEKMPLHELLQMINSAVRCLDNGSGVLILADMEPITGMEAAIQKESNTPCKILPSVTLSFLMETISNCSKGASLEQFSSHLSAKKPSYHELSKEEFISHLVNDIFARTLLYVNPKKATDTLLYSLNIILENLHMEYTQEIAVKYLSHGVHMIERMVRNIPLPYYRLKQFTDANYQLMDLIAQSLIVVSDTFAVSIPSSEIAYLAEIFLSFQSI